MSKIRAEENALLIWNAKHARTAWVSEEELIALERWTQGQNNGFSDRLKKLEILCDEDMPTIREAITASANRKAPPRSFCAPESLHIELTSQCPLNCSQCYKTSSMSELSLEFLLDVIDQADKMNVFQIALGGGEPLVYRHLLAVIGGIAKRGMASSITTSGIGLEPCLLGKLRQAGLNHIQISLNGSREEIHARSRDGYAHTINALKLLAHSGISFGINWVARMDNIDDFPQLIDMAKDSRAQNINILRYKPSPKEKFADVDLPPKKLAFLATMMRDAKGITIKVDSAFSNLLCHLNKRTGFFTGCGAGRRFLALDADGCYRPCSHVDLKEQGNNLADVWIHSPNLAMFRSIPQQATEPCRSCKNLPGCCGCRAVVLNQGLDFSSGDKTCVFVKDQ